MEGCAASAIQSDVDGVEHDRGELAYQLRPGPKLGFYWRTSCSIQNAVLNLNLCSKRLILTCHYQMSVFSCAAGKGNTGIVRNPREV